jgi:hypothetical protein
LNLKDRNTRPEISFFRDYDHVGYDREAILNDMQRIKVTKTKENSEEGFCQTDDFMLLHWRGYLKDKKVEDSREWFHRPKVFQLGHYEVTKCWDIALQQMRQGESAIVHCPGDLDKGGVQDQYIHDDTAAWIPEFSDMKYEFDVLECGINPPSLRPGVYDMPIEGGQCFYIVSLGPEGKGSHTAIEVAETSRYDPKYGIFNIGLAEYRG